MSFQAEYTKLERFLPKNQRTQRKLLNFENWLNGDASKNAKIWLSKSIFVVKNHWNLSQFFSIKEYQFRSTSFCYWHFLITSIFKSLYFLKWCPIFDTSPLTQVSKFNNFLWVCWFLGKNNSNFVYPDNPYCHTHYVPICTIWQFTKLKPRCELFDTL